MNIQVSWLLEGHIVLVIAPEAVDNEDMPEVDKAIIRHFEAGQSDLMHVVFDARATKQTPNLKTMTTLRFSRHPKNGWAIMVGDLHPIVKMMVTLAAKVVRGRFRIMDTTDNAVAFLRAIDLSIPRDAEVVSTET